MKMLLFLIGCCSPFVAQACFCVSLGINKEYQIADAVFIGRLAEKTEIQFYMPGRHPAPLQLFHFEVFRISKGMEPYDNKATVVNYHHATNCGELFREQIIGDTILVFAKFIDTDGLRILSSSPCRGNLTVNHLARHDSLHLIDQFPWNTITVNDPDYTHEQSNTESSSEKEVEAPTSDAYLITFLIISLALNIFQILRNKRLSGKQ